VRLDKDVLIRYLEHKATVTNASTSLIRTPPVGQSYSLNWGCIEATWCTVLMTACRSHPGCDSLSGGTNLATQSRAVHLLTGACNYHT